MDTLVKNKNVFTLIFIILFSVSNLAIQSNIEFSVKGIFLVTISPFQKLFHISFNTMARLWAGITELNYLKEELSKTRNNLQKYEEIAQNLTEIKNENIRLRENLGFKNRISYDVISAEVISKSPNNFYRVFIINKGSSDGVKKYMPVVAYQKGEKALVGKIIEVRWNISKIMPISDTLSKIGGTLQNSRFVGIVNGNAPLYNHLTMNYIDLKAPLTVNENVVTSGEAGIFPPGLLIGKVIKFQERMAGGYKNCQLMMHVDFGKLDYVFIIKKDVNQALMDFKSGFSKESKD